MNLRREGALREAEAFRTLRRAALAEVDEIEARAHRLDYGDSETAGLLKARATVTRDHLRATRDAGDVLAVVPLLEGLRRLAPAPDTERRVRVGSAWVPWSVFGSYDALLVAARKIGAEESPEQRSRVLVAGARWDGDGKDYPAI